MSRIITFSMNFPTVHPKAGEPTNFVEKLCNAFQEIGTGISEIDELDLDQGPWEEFGKKWHTIRAGRRWKTGDKFSPRVWSGKPYNSRMVTIADDVEIVNVWDFEIKVFPPSDLIAMHHSIAFINGQRVIGNQYFELAENDGLTYYDFIDWFMPKGKLVPFDGQIICWKPGLQY